MKRIGRSSSIGLTGIESAWNKKSASFATRLWDFLMSQNVGCVRHFRRMHCAYKCVHADSFFFLGG